MKQRVESILRYMTELPSSTSLKGFAENQDGSFALQTELSSFGHQTQLKYEATGDNHMFRIEIVHTFGYLDKDVAPNTAANQLLRMLAHNTGSFSTTTAFMGVVSLNNRLEATLNSFHHFLSKWSDEEIAEALSLHLFDLTMGLTTQDPSLTMLRMFGDED
jgi:hypothetical protein